MNQDQENQNPQVSGVPPTKPMQERSSGSDRSSNMSGGEVLARLTAVAMASGLSAPLINVDLAARNALASSDHEIFQQVPDIPPTAIFDPGATPTPEIDLISLDQVSNLSITNPDGTQTALSETDLNLADYQSMFNQLVNKNGILPETFTPEHIMPSIGEINGQQVAVFMLKDQVGQNEATSAFCFVENPDGETYQFYLAGPSQAAKVGKANGLNINPDNAAFVPSTPGWFGLVEKDSNDPTLVKPVAMYSWYNAAFSVDQVTGKPLPATDEQVAKGIFALTVDVPATPEAPKVIDNGADGMLVDWGDGIYKLTFGSPEKPLGKATPEASGGLSPEYFTATSEAGVYILTPEAVALVNASPQALFQDNKYLPDPPLIEDMSFGGAAVESAFAKQARDLKIGFGAEKVIMSSGFVLNSPIAPIGGIDTVDGVQYAYVNDFTNRVNADGSSQMIMKKMYFINVPPEGAKSGRMSLNYNMDYDLSVYVSSEGVQALFTQLSDGERHQIFFYQALNIDHSKATYVRQGFGSTVDFAASHPMAINIKIQS